MNNMNEKIIAKRNIKGTLKDLKRLHNINKKKTLQHRQTQLCMHLVSKYRVGGGVRVY